MATALDVAEYILGSAGSMSATKLQKLVYASQAFSMAREGKPIYLDRIEAWAGGPVVRDLLEAMGLRDHLKSGGLRPGRADALTEAERNTVDAVLATYGSKSERWLSDAAYNDGLWRSVRGDFNGVDREAPEITPSLIAEYYASRREPW